MRLALEEATLAEAMGEAPVGAVLTDLQGRILARAHNRTVTDMDPTSHAEMLCLRQGAGEAGNHRLTESILTVTLEPCLMCLGAVVQARLAGVVYGAPDPKAGALASRLRGNRLEFTNHRFPILGGVLEGDCGEMLRRFFRQRRT